MVHNAAADRNISISLAFKDNRRYTATHTSSAAHGCRKLYCIAGFPDHEPSKERLQGFIDAMNDHDLAFDDSCIFYGNYWRDIPEQIARDIANEKIKCPDGVVCLSDPKLEQALKTV